MRGILFPAVAIAATLTGCQSEPAHAPDANELYTRDFIRHFGPFDSSHDWNMATRASVEVNATTPTDYNVYAEIDGHRYLAGRFEGVQGITTLHVDVPKGAETVTAVAGKASSNEALAWIIAAEDLGHNDFDFNDVVFGVTNYKESGGTATIDIVPLAAGGTMPIHILYKGKEIYDNKEFHTWFDGDHTSSTAINVGGYTAQGKTVTIEVDKDFTMAHVDGESNMGGFSIRVGDRTSTTINAPDLNAGVAEAPQMICVPQSWQWPTELTPITEAYPEFKDWSADQSACTDWHEKPQEGLTIKHDFTATVPTLPDNVFALEGELNGDPIYYSDGTYYIQYKYVLPDEITSRLKEIDSFSVNIHLEDGMSYQLGSYRSDATFTGNTTCKDREISITSDKFKDLYVDPLLVVSYLKCPESFSEKVMIKI